MNKRLGVNIDHVATLRQARLGKNPDVLEAAQQAIRGGADLITMHLREDRRHIQDADVFAFKKKFKTSLNFEMAVTPEMFKLALKLKPASVCLVPEKRQELTTEGGLDLSLKYSFLLKQIPRLQKAGISVFPFVDPDIRQITLCKKLGCDGIELHTGEYAQEPSVVQIERLKHAAQVAHAMGLEVHAGHGLDYQNVKALLKISEITEFNIGHSVVARAVFVGLNRAVREMRTLMG